MSGKCSKCLANVANVANVEQMYGKCGKCLPNVANVLTLCIKLCVLHFPGDMHIKKKKKVLQVNIRLGYR